MEDESCMARTTIASPDIAWGPLPISRAVRTGNLVFVSGIPGFTRDFQLAKGDFAAQMRQAMENIGAILRRQRDESPLNRLCSDGAP